jgi:hypothetical protein
VRSPRFHAGIHAMPPPEFGNMLRAAPLRIAVSVPDDILEDWFAPDTGLNPISHEAIVAAERYAKIYECEFKYYPERLEGLFWKWVPAI